jgi:hypothetical protein
MKNFFFKELYVFFGWLDDSPGPWNLVTYLLLLFNVRIRILSYTREDLV